MGNLFCTVTKAEFFAYHVCKVTHCESCGFKIESPGPKNIAHILPKELFKSVALVNDNTMYLCSDLDKFNGKGCHDLYDKSWDSARTLPIWETAVSRFNNFKHLIKEKSLTLLNFTEHGSK